MGKEEFRTSLVVACGDPRMEVELGGMVDKVTHVPVFPYSHKAGRQSRVASHLLGELFLGVWSARRRRYKKGPTFTLSVCVAESRHVRSRSWHTEGSDSSV